MNTHIFLSSLWLGLASAIISVVINVIMPNEPILNWWFRFGEKYGKEIVHNKERERLIYRPIWGCEKCFSGQIAFWVYFFSHVTANMPVEWQERGWFDFPGYNIFSHIFAVCTAIFTAVIFSHYINKIKDANN